MLPSETNPSTFSSEVEKSMNGFKAHMKTQIHHWQNMLRGPCYHFGSEELRFYAVKDNDQKHLMTIFRICDDDDLKQEN